MKLAQEVKSLCEESSATKRLETTLMRMATNRLTFNMSEKEAKKVLKYIKEKNSKEEWNEVAELNDKDLQEFFNDSVESYKLFYNIKESSDSFIIRRTQDDGRFTYFNAIKRAHGRSFPFMVLSKESAKIFKSEKDAKDMMKAKAFDRPDETFEIVKTK